MSLVDLVMPKLGESIMEATILRWHKKPGDKVAQDEPVLDIATDKVDSDATDKVDSEVPSIAEGTLTEVLFNENDVVPIGTVIARIDTANGSATTGSTPAQAPQSIAPVYEEAKVVEEVPYQPAATAATGSTGGARFYSPLVLNIAQSEGISMSELENIPGTGQDGRVSKKDILAYVANRGSKPTAATQTVQVVTQVKRYRL